MVVSCGLPLACNAQDYDKQINKNDSKNDSQVFIEAAQRVKAADVDEKSLRELYYTSQWLTTGTKSSGLALKTFTKALINLRKTEGMTKKDVNQFSQSMTDMIANLGFTYGFNEKKIAEVVTAFFNLQQFMTEKGGEGGKNFCTDLIKNLSTVGDREKLVITLSMSPQGMETAIATGNYSVISDALAEKFEAYEAEYGTK
jgi:hypothetical protein